MTTAARLKLAFAATVISVTSTILIGALPARASGAAQSEATIDQVVGLELNRDGLEVAAAALQRQALKPIDRQALPDVKQALPLGVELSLGGLNLSARFGDLHLAPQNGLLAASTTLTSLQLHINEVKFSSVVFGRRLVTTCSSVDLYLGDKRPVEVGLSVVPSVKDRLIALTGSQAAVVLGYNNARIAGPASCRLVDTGGLTQGLLQVALAVVQPFVEELVNQRLLAALPNFQDQLNQAASRPLQLAVPPLPGSSPGVVWLRPFPTALTVDADGLKITAGATFALRQVAAQEQGPLAGEPSAFSSLKVATLGINPAVIGTAFQLLFPHGSGVIDIDESTVPGLKAVLSVQSAAAFWPDLLRQEPQEPYVRLQVRVTTAPELTVTPAGLALHLQGLELGFLVFLHNRWTPYFVINLALTGQADAALSQDSLRLALHDAPQLSLTGSWAPGYQPIDPRL